MPCPVRAALVARSGRVRWIAASETVTRSRGLTLFAAAASSSHPSGELPLTRRGSVTDNSSQSVTTRALHLDQVGLRYAGSRDPLSRGRPNSFLKRPQDDRALSTRRLVQGFDDAYILQSFF